MANRKLIELVDDKDRKYVEESPFADFVLAEPNFIDWINWSEHGESVKEDKKQSKRTFWLAANAVVRKPDGDPAFPTEEDFNTGGGAIATMVVGAAAHRFLLEYGREEAEEKKAT